MEVSFACRTTSGGVLSDWVGAERCLNKSMMMTLVMNAEQNTHMHKICVFPLREDGCK